MDGTEVVTTSLGSTTATEGAVEAMVVVVVVEEETTMNEGTTGATSEAVEGTTAMIATTVEEDTKGATIDPAVMTGRATIVTTTNTAEDGTRTIELEAEAQQETTMAAVGVGTEGKWCRTKTV